MENIFDLIVNVKNICCNLSLILIGIIIGLIGNYCCENTINFKTRKIGDWVCEYFDIIIPLVLIVVAFIFLYFGKDNLFTCLFSATGICMALFQERLRIRFSKPELTIKLVDSMEKVDLQNKRPALYYHLLIENTKAQYCLAKNVQCFLEKVWRKNESTLQFEQLSLPHILVLRWAFTRDESFRQSMEIRRPTLCDFGRLLKSIAPAQTDIFEPYTYQKPGQFDKWQLKGQNAGENGGTIIYKVVVCADYFPPKSTYIEVEWDGKWMEYSGDWKDSKNNPEKMKEHFKISQMSQTEFNSKIGNI